MLSKRVVLLVVALACLFALTPSALFSQTAGTVSGLVTDPSRAAVADATVTLTDTATHSAQTTTTNAAGRYVFVNVASGVYDVAISKTGFRATKISNQKVTVGSELTLNIALEVGAMTQVVEVKAVVGAELQTENATMGSTVTGDMLLAMPSLNRDASSILTLQPATAPSVGGGDIYGGQVAGSLSDQNTYMLDGGNFTSDLEGDNGYQHSGMGGIPTPIESIEELKVATNNQTADFSTSAGGQVMMVTKRGADAFHGSAYEFFQSQLFNANTWDNNRHGGTGLNARTKFHDNRFGGSVGGPLLPGKHLGGKTYFYGFYEGRRFPGTASVPTWTVPSAAARVGIIKFRLKDPVTNVSTVHAYNLNPSPTLDPSVGIKDNDPLIGTMLPTAMCGAVTCDPRNIGISPVVSTMWNKFMPAPNDESSSSGDTLNTQGFRATLTLP